MTRWLAMLAAALVLVCAADAGAAPRGQKAQKAQKARKAPSAAHELPLHLYIAKGESNACGSGCSMWIAVEGRFDSGAAGRVNAFLKRHAARKLPVYFHSPGGSSRDAIAIGRQLRKLGLTTGVGRTVVRGCASTSDVSDACRAAKRAPQPIEAAWRPDGTCSSACVWAMIGGKVRHVPPASRLGVHSGRLTLFRKSSDGRVRQITAKQAPSLHKSRAAEFDAQNRRYIREMGLDGALFDTALKVPHESIYYLSRDQIAAFGIDRRDYAETSWFIQPSGKTTYLAKWIVEARGPERKDRRLSIIAFSCAPRERARVQYMRGLASDELAGPPSVTVTIGDRKASLTMTGYPSRRDAIDAGSSFAASGGWVPFAAFEAVASVAAVEIAEFDALAAKRPPRVLKLSTNGLADGINALRNGCGKPPA
jgi:hypothetical protein